MSAVGWFDLLIGMSAGVHHSFMICCFRMHGGVSWRSLSLSMLAVETILQRIRVHASRSTAVAKDELHAPVIEQLWPSDCVTGGSNPPVIHCTGFFEGTLLAAQLGSWSPYMALKSGSETSDSPGEIVWRFPKKGLFGRILIL